jgi:tRNA:m4X modification enzyme
VWLKQKHRFCPWPVPAGGALCGHHATARVACPLDPSHSVAQCDLEAHLRRCTAGREAEAAAQLSYLVPGFNAAPCEPAAQEEAARQREEAEALWRTRPDSPDFPAARAEVLRVAALLLAAAAPLPPLSPPPPLPERVRAALARARAAAAEAHAVEPWEERHALQQAGLLASLGPLLPPPPGAVCVELGAGRGYLSALLAACCDQPPRALLVDRRAYRNKAERSLRRSGGAEVSRLRCDVADLDLGRCCEGAAPLLLIAKHFCGAATDHALRAAARCGPRLAGLAVAACCHHACTFESYAAPDWCAAAGLGAREFALAARIASWCVDAHGCAPAPEEEAGCSRWGLSAAERVAAGGACKRWLDEGRAAWLAGRLGAPVRVAAFVDASVSPENRVILYGGILDAYA